LALAHVIMIMMGSVQAEQAFYTVPHHIGYYTTEDPDIIEAQVIEGRMKKVIKGKKGGVLSDLQGFMKKSNEA
jgi:hypothetical protein